MIKTDTEGMKSKQTKSSQLLLKGIEKLRHVNEI